MAVCAKGLVLVFYAVFAGGGGGGGGYGSGRFSGSGVDDQLIFFIGLSQKIHTQCKTNVTVKNTLFSGFTP